MAAPRKPRIRPRALVSNSKAAKRSETIPGEVIRFGPELCTDLVAAEEREWLVTNGIGGFASGTVAGPATRRYHGLLLAALDPPAKRTLLLGAIDEILHIEGEAHEFATHRWLSGAIAPQGYRHISEFRLDGTIPVWTYRAGEAVLEKRVWMRHGENTSLVRYTLLGSTSPAELELKALVNYRDFHSATHAGSPPNEWHMRVEPIENGLRVTAFDGATPFYLKSKDAIALLQHVWYRDFFFALERERGLDDHEDQIFAAVFRARVEPGESITLVVSTDRDATLDGDGALNDELVRQTAVLNGGKSLLKFATNPQTKSRISQLVLAADQFITARPLPGQPDGKTILAGYHWFGDWGRDTMIALPGLTLATGRPDIARQILLAISRFVDRGMLPNNFPDRGGVPEYNTIDATLWYFQAIRQYFRATNDNAMLKKLFPVLTEIIEAHLTGTRYNIHVDPDDGLLYGGGPGAQLTWMDAKIGEWVVTPRTGKPVEINALWINALESVMVFAEALGQSFAKYVSLLEKAKSSFAKFWNPERNCCFDVLDSPGIGNDAALRPNQIFAVSLGEKLLAADQQKSVVDTCAARLLTPFGLRSLAQDEPGYIGRYAGGVRERDTAYHQGTVWSWLLGPFALAHYRVYRDRTAALAFLDPLMKSLDTYGLGTLGEIYDGDSPHRPRGCIAQAWAVAELLRAWQFLT